MSERRLLIFARAPQPGAVKTRLIPALGAQGAAWLYAWMLQRTLDRALAAALAPVDCYVDPGPESAWFDRYRSVPGLRLLSQPSGDLGQRMQACFSQALEEARDVVLIGTDCPALQAQHLARAFEVLALGHRAVLGPAEDGGYVLIGLREQQPNLFQGIQWGGDRVYADSIARLDALGWGWSALDPLWDVDRPEDLQRLARLAADAPLPLSLRA